MLPEDAVDPRSENGLRSEMELAGEVTPGLEREGEKVVDLVGPPPPALLPPPPS